MANNRGFIQLIVILVLVVMILSLLGVSLSVLFQNPTLKENFSFIGDALSALWSSWFGRTAGVVWDFAWNFFTDLIWQPFLNAIDAIKRGDNPILNQ